MNFALEFFTFRRSFRIFGSLILSILLLSFA